MKQPITNKTMTKEQEINILKAACEQLGEDSYLGPWLKRALPSIEYDILCDMRPQSYGEAERYAYETISNAEMKACEIIKRAVEECERKEIACDALINTRKESARQRAMEAVKELF